MSALKNSRGSEHIVLLVALAALLYMIAMFALFGGSARSPAAWIGRSGSIAVIGGVLLYDRVFVAAGRIDERNRTPGFARALIVGGIVAIVAGFALGTIGY